MVVVQGVGHLLLPMMKSMAKLFSQSEERNLLAIPGHAFSDRAS